MAAYQGDLIGHHGKKSLIVKFEPCAEEAVFKAHDIPDHLKKNFSAAIVTVNGRKHRACWIEFGDKVLILHPNKGRGSFPRKDLFPRI